MIDELRAAIAADDWPRALVLALDAWRDSRAPQLADLVDRVATKCPTEQAPRHRVQPWWIPRARTYDPIVATALLASASDLAHKSDVTWEVIAQAHAQTSVVQRLHAAISLVHELYVRNGLQPPPMFQGVAYRNLVERLAVLSTWPDDPRVARVLAAWFCDAKVTWHYPNDVAVLVLYEILVDELIRLRDSRVIPQLEQALAEPRGKTVPIRDRIRQLAARAIDELAASVIAMTLLPDDVAAEIAQWCPVAHEPPPVDETALWRDAAASEDARLVLADFLLQRGDRRGEIITLACSGTDDNTRRSSSLLHEYWERWLGDLALVLDRGHCTFAGGLLDVATVGTHGTPEWAYPKVARHRELASVRVVRPGWNASDRGYVAFLDAMPSLPPRIRIHATMIEALIRARPRWPIRELELVTNLPDLERPLRELLAIAAPALPDVELVEFPAHGELDAGVIAAIGELPRLFPALARVHVDAARWIPEPLRDALVALQARSAFVTVDHGTYRP